MKMKQEIMNVLVVSLAAAFLGLPFVAFAEQDEGFGYTISEVVARQRWPWEHQVDIDFLLTKPAGVPESQLVRIGVVASNGTHEVAMSSESLRGTVVAPNGYRRLVWDPKMDHSEPLSSHLTFHLSVVATNVIADYMVIDLETGGVAYKEVFFAEEVNSDLYKTTKMAFRYIPPGTFNMKDQYGTHPSPQTYPTTLTKGFYIGVFEVTQAQWKNVKGLYPNSYFTVERDMRPVEYVSYDDIRGPTLGTNWPSNSNVDADSFLGMLRDRTDINELDLPTEAQWAFACHAGTTTYYSDGETAAPHDGVSQNGAVSNQFLNVLGRYRYNGGYIDGETIAPPADCGPVNGTAIVGSYLPNPWGVYDMHGNVDELCRDRWNYTLTGGEDPVGKTDLTYETFVRRSGSWQRDASECSSLYRTYRGRSQHNSGIGFRLVRFSP